jgi:hypothetical protein
MYCRRDYPIQPYAKVADHPFALAHLKLVYHRNPLLHMAGRILEHRVFISLKNIESDLHAAVVFR